MLRGKKGQPLRGLLFLCTPLYTPIAGGAMKRFVISCLVGTFPCLAATAAAAATCDTLATLALKDAKVTRAELVPAGHFTRTDDEPAAANAYRSLPDFCLGAATLPPSIESDMKIEVWMPATDWNGTVQGQ